MHLLFPESRIRSLSAAYKIGLLEPQVIGMRSRVTSAGFLTRDQLYVVARWKAARSAEHVLKNSEAYVREVTAFALGASEERSRIEALTVLDGVLWPSASVILHMFHQEPYPILDFRALESLGEEVPKQYTFAYWWKYVLHCRKLATKHKLSMRELDRALWQHSAAKRRTR